MKWVHVSKAHRCQICSKVDWCSYSETLIHCQRVPSDRPARSGEGWIHKRGSASLPIPEKKPVEFNNSNLIEQYNAMLSDTEPEDILSFAKSIGVSATALTLLGAARYGICWAFPMRNSTGNLTGIRIRCDSKKWAIQGSRQGLFIPKLDVTSLILVCEGPTDTAAAITLGMYAIGRPNCSAIPNEVCAFIRVNRVRRVVLIPDNDPVGIRGAENLEGLLRVPYVRWMPPTKDLREFVRRGGNQAQIEAAVKDLIWTNP